mgnify:CR=1 FL=1
MKLDEIKPLGAFVENTIRPLIEEMRWFLEELSKRNIFITEDNVKQIVSSLAKQCIKIQIIKSIETVILAIIIGFIACRI